MSFAKSKRFFRSIGFRLNAWYVALFLVSTVVLLLLANYVVIASVETKESALITARLIEERARYEEGGIASVVDGLADPNQPRRDESFLRVSDVFNRTVYLHLPNDQLAFDPSSIEVKVGEDSRRWLTARAKNDGSVWNVGAIDLDDGGFLQVGLSEARSQETLDHLRTGFAVVLLGGLVACLLGGAYLTRQVLRPIRELTEVARGVISSGDFSLRVPTRESDDDLDQLSQLFNRALEKNQALVRGMRESLDNVAHDLRTPLTRLRGGAELALRSENPDSLREALADTLEESDRVLAMLQTLMDISEAENGTMSLARKPTDLSVLAREALELYEHVALDKWIMLSSELTATAEISVDRNRMRQVIANLLDNAIKYTPPGGQVKLSTRQAGDAVVVEVSDTGTGIAESDRDHIWERLFRADKSRSQRGLGLGLSLVKAIVEAHGGVVSVTSALDCGSIFVVRMPVAKVT